MTVAFTDWDGSLPGCNPECAVAEHGQVFGVAVTCLLSVNLTAAHTAYDAFSAA